VRLIDRQLGVTIWQGSCNNNKKKKQNLELKRDMLVVGETYEGKSRGSESRPEPALLKPLPPGILCVFFMGVGEE
jgi:hypothetical protein